VRGEGAVGAFLAVGHGDDAGLVGELLQSGFDPPHGVRYQRPGAVADAGADVVPQDDVGSGADVRLDQGVPAAGVGAAVVVLLGVLADLDLRVTPALAGLDVLAALEAVRQRARREIGTPHPFQCEHGIDPVAPLRRVRVGLGTDVRGGRRDELDPVAELLRGADPLGEQDPFGELDDVLHDDAGEPFGFHGA
jgi:hypothetical protein